MAPSFPSGSSQPSPPALSSISSRQLRRALPEPPSLEASSTLSPTRSAAALRRLAFPAWTSSASSPPGQASLLRPATSCRPRRHWTAPPHRISFLAGLPCSRCRAVDPALAAPLFPLLRTASTTTKPSSCVDRALPRLVVPAWPQPAPGPAKAGPSWASSTKRAKPRLRFRSGVVRIRSTPSVCLLHGLVLLPCGISVCRCR
ncbi:hypothetical protein VPH35_090684 [Triticum aestivum]